MSMRSGARAAALERRVTELETLVHQLIAELKPAEQKPEPVRRRGRPRKEENG